MYEGEKLGWVSFYEPDPKQLASRGVAGEKLSFFSSEGMAKLIGKTGPSTSIRCTSTSLTLCQKLLQDLSGKDLPARHGPSKPGEQLRGAVDPASAGHAFGWRP